MTHRSNPQTIRRTTSKWAAPRRAAFALEAVSRLVAAHAVILVVVVLITTPSGAG
jgi:hypothetical protein